MVESTHLQGGCFIRTFWASHAAGDYLCDDCPQAEYPEGFQCKALDNVTLDAQNRLHTSDPVMRVSVFD